MTGTLIALVVMAVSGNSPGPMEEEWKWSDDQASILHYFMNASGDYPVQLIRDNDAGWNEVGVRIGGEEDLLLEFQTHREGAFVFADTIIIYAVFSMYASGCELRACDLEAGEEIWRRPLLGIGEISHSKYRNRINLEVRKDNVIVYGNEFGGKYIEVLDVKTGSLDSNTRVGRMRR